MMKIEVGVYWKKQQLQIKAPHDTLLHITRTSKNHKVGSDVLTSGHQRKPYTRMFKYFWNELANKWVANLSLTAH